MTDHKQPALQGQAAHCQACGGYATHEVDEGTDFPGAYCDECGPGGKQQAQAGEPELPPLPTYWRKVADADGIEVEVFRAFQMRDYARAAMQSHRKAMVVQAWSKEQAFCLAMLKKDAALKACVEALETCTPGDYSTGHVISPSFDEQAVNAAITQAQEALK